MVIGSYILIMTLTVNGLNVPTTGQVLKAAREKQLINTRGSL